MSAERLAYKYEELLALRREREALERNGVLHLDGDAGLQRKARCRRLAAEFPGSLRELEVLSSADLEQRLKQVQSGGDLAAFIARYHALGRAMAALKRWQGAFRRRYSRRPTLGEARAALCLKFLFDPELRAALGLKFLFDPELERWLAPPAGRVHELVWQRIAAEQGESVERCKARLLSPSV